MDRTISGLSGLKRIRTAKVNGEESMVKGDKGEPLSPMGRVYHEPGTNLYIIAIIGWKSKVHHDLLKANLMQTLFKHPRFSSLQVGNNKNGGEIKWFPTIVDFDNHFIVPDVDQNMDSPDKFVEDYVSNLSTTTIDMSKPLWDFHHLNLKTSDAEAVSVIRAHHSIGDGTSLMSQLLACTRKTSNSKALPTITVTKRSNATHIGGFFSMFKMVWNTLIGIIMGLMTALFLKDTETPLKGPLAMESNARHFVHRTVSLNDIKLVKNSMNATINDVMVGVIQAALSRYLNRRYGEGKMDQEKISYLPKDIRFRTLVLINLRKSGVVPALVDVMKSKEDGWGNEIGYVLLPLTIAFQDDPLDYVREAKVAMDRKKASLEANFTYFIVKLFLKFFGSKVAGVLCHKYSSNATMCFSNLVGPEDEITLYGHPIAYIAPSCYGQPSALLIHVVSYVNKMTFVVSADVATIPDPHQLCDDLEDSLKLMKNAVIEGHVMDG